MLITFWGIFLSGVAEVVILGSQQKVKICKILFIYMCTLNILF